MKKAKRNYQMLGTNLCGTQCCILKCALPFCEIKDKTDLKESDFDHDSTSWSGCDFTKNTLSYRNFKLTGNEFKLSKPLVMTGVDCDMGHFSEWQFVVKKIVEVKDITDEIRYKNNKIDESLSRARRCLLLDDLNWEKKINQIDSLVEQWIE